MSIIGHRGIQVLSDINSVDDLPEIADVESEAVWYIESGDFAQDYIAPSFWDGEQFNEWISLVDGEVLDGIPDSVVSRPDDDNDTSSTANGGLHIELKTNWPSIGAEISNNTTGATKAYLYDLDNDSYGSSELIDETDISGLSSGDAFAFKDVNLDSGQEYVIVVDAEGSSYTRGFSGDADDYPYEEDDIDIIGEASGGDVSTAVGRGVNNIGNPQGIID